MITRTDPMISKDNYKALTNGMKQNKDKFNFVSHSMGGAFSEGMIRYLAEQGWETSNVVFLNAWDPSRITNKEEGNRIDATCSNDPVQLLSIPLLGKPDIPFSDKRIRMYSDKSMFYRHKDLIGDKSDDLWVIIRSLLKQ